MAAARGSVRPPRERGTRRRHAPRASRAAAGGTAGVRRARGVGELRQCFHRQPPLPRPAQSRFRPYPRLAAGEPGVLYLPGAGPHKGAADPETGVSAATHGFRAVRDPAAGLGAADKGERARASDRVPRPEPAEPGGASTV